MLSNRPENTLAILIGIGEFDKMDDLHKCENSAIEFERILLDKNYLGLPPENVKRLCKKKDGHNLTNIVDWIRNIIGDVSDRKKNGKQVIDTIIYYYSGHGDTASDKKLYLYAKDTSPKDLSQTGIEYENEKNKLSGVVKKIIFILDCCYSGAAQGLKETINLDIDATYSIIYSSASFQRSFFNQFPEYTNFSHVLFELINKGMTNPFNPFITISDIGNYLNIAFLDKPDQTPNVKGIQTMLAHKLFNNIKYNLDSVEEKLNSVEISERKIGIDHFYNILENYKKEELSLNAGRIKHITQKLFQEVYNNEINDQIF